MEEFVRLQTSILLRRFVYQMSRTAKSGDANSIHDLRVAIRRLSRCLKMFAQFYPRHTASRIRAELDALMDAAGEVRDRDILLKMLPKAGIAKRSPVVARLQNERRAGVRHLVSEIRRYQDRDFSRKWRRRLEI